MVPDAVPPGTAVMVVENGAWPLASNSEREAVRVAVPPDVYVTENDLDAVAPVESVRVIIHVLVPVGSPFAVTTGCRVMELSELITTLLFHFESFFSQVAAPFTDPLHVKSILLISVKLLPVTTSVD